MRRAALLLLVPTAAVAQAPAPSPQLDRSVAALVPLLAGKGDYARYFDPRFKAAVPETQLRAILAQLGATLGGPERIVRTVPTSRWSADVTVGFARGTADLRIAIAPDAPHGVTGLLVTGTTIRGDSLATIAAEVRALPGKAGIGIYALGSGAPAPMLEIAAGDAAPLGSAFKLWVLTEAQRQVTAGTRRWADVGPAGPPSLGGVLGGWPAGSPVTLQTLATMMISVSDNSATDTLMQVLGRDAVDAMAAANGGAVPVPTTREVIAIKSDPALTAVWTQAGPDARRRLLIDNAARFAGMRLDPGVFAGNPVAIDSVEWFASPAAIVGTLDRLRTGGGVPLDILAVSPGVDPTTAARFGYLGFKGGSEPGVVTLNYLARTRGGRWYAVAGNWHRSDAVVNEAAFVALMTRALAVVAAR